MIYSLAFFDRNLISPILPLLIREWHIFFLGAGIISSLTLITYGLGQIPAGYLSDKYNRRTMILIGGLAVGLINLLQGILKNFSSFVFFRSIFGIATAGCLSPAMALIKDIVPLEHRAKAFSLLSLGTTLGPLLALLWGKHIMAQYHWSTVFMGAAIPVFVITGLVALFIKEDKPKPIFAAHPSDTQSFGWDSYKLAFLDKRLWVLYLVWFCMIWTFYTVLQYLPTFLAAYLHYPNEKAASVASGWLWTELIVSLPRGWISDKLKNRKKFTCIVTVLASLGILFIPYAPKDLMFPLLLSIGCCWFSTSGTFYAWSSEICAEVSSFIVASGLALTSFFGQLGGAAGIAVSGQLADWFGVKYIISSAGIVALLGIFMSLWLPKSFSDSRNTEHNIPS